jgi:hypothetical protein
MPNPLATAFVRIRGQDGGLAADISKMAGPAAKGAGQDAGRQFSGQFTDSVRDGARRSAQATAEAGADAGRGFAERFTEQVKDTTRGAGQAGQEGGDRFSQAFQQSADAGGEGIGGKFREIGAKAGGLFLAAFAVTKIVDTIQGAFSDALDLEAGRAKLTAQLNLTAEDSQRYGEVAGKLYAGAYGDSLDQVNDAISSVARNIGDAATESSADLESVSGSVLNLASTFDQDLGGVTKAVGTLIQTGMVKSAQQGLDLLTAGFQNGANKADDLLDTMTEYPTQFRKLGLDGQTSLGLINQAIAGGARDADVAADALKEFSIRAVDGSATSAAGFKALGLNAKTMTAQIARGGKDASDGLQTVLDRLRGIEDPVKRNAAAVALFGTQAEDLGSALLDFDPSTAVKGLGDVTGAAQKMNDTLGDTAASRIESFKRTVTQGLTSVAGSVLGGLEGVYDLLVKGDFTAKFREAFHVEEDSPVVGFLFDVRDGVRQVQAAAQLLITGDFTGGIGKALGVEEDSDLVGRILGIRDAIAQAIGGVKALLTGGSSADIAKAFGLDRGSEVVATLVSLRGSFITFVGTVRTIFGQVAASVQAGLGPVMPYVRQAFTAAQQIIGNVMAIVAIYVRQGVATMQLLWRVFGPTILAFIGPAMRAIAQTIAGTMQVVAGITRTVLALLRGDWSGAAAGIRQIVTGLGNIIVGTWRSSANLMRALVSAAVAVVKALFGDMASSVKSRISAAVAEVRGFGSRVRSALGNLGGILVDAGRSLINGLISGIEDRIGALQAKVSGVAGTIRDYFPFSPAKKGPLRRYPMERAGRNIVTGLAEGMAAAEAVNAGALSIVERMTVPNINKRARLASSAGRQQALRIAKEDMRALAGLLAEALNGTERPIVLNSDLLAGSLDRQLGTLYR